MSVASKKNKEAKGRQNVLPKLKTILANPYKSKCPTLEESDLEKFKIILCSAIKNSGLEARAFAKSKHIYLGLESCLRAINNCQISCVFLSLSLKPCFLVGLIAQNVKTKDETVPTYVQPSLEKTIENVFGIKALAMALPVNMETISKDLSQWTVMRRLPKTVKTLVDKKFKRISTGKKVHSSPNNISNVVKQEFNEVSKQKPSESFSANFISFSNPNDTMEWDQVDLEKDKDDLLGVLNKMTRTKTLNTTTEISAEHALETFDNKIELQSDSDDFEEEYQSLTVKKVCPNPYKKSKKKRKKNKNMKKN